MKKLLLLLLTFVLAISMLGLFACDTPDNSGGIGDNQQQEQPNENNGGNQSGGSAFTVEKAYEKAQDLGYKGSLEEFMETLKGNDGKDGEDGADGVGIKSVEIINGDLIITLTDNTVINCGQVVADELKTYTVTFDCDFATIPSQTVKHGEKIKEPEIYEDGLEIIGIYYQNKEWSFIGYVVTEDMTLKVDVKVVGTSGLVYELAGGEYRVTDYTGTAKKVYIPDTYNNIPVTSIGYQAFDDCTSLTSITIPNSVTSIGIQAFYGCSSIRSITIPNSVTSIGARAFIDCSVLTSITVESGNSKYHSKDNCIIETATNTLITGCKNSIIPNYVTRIGDYAFEGCRSLENLIIPNSVTSIGSGAFEYCSSLTSITIPNSVTSIGIQAFCGCSSIRSITIPNSVTSIGARAFSGCSSLESITVESGNTEYHSKDNCIIGTATNTLVTGCKNSIIPNYVTRIGNSAFSGCRSLTSINIPNSVTSIGSGAFSGCSDLTSITIPDSVTSIGGDVFSACSSLESITVESGNSKYHSKDNCLIETGSNTLILGCKNSIIPNYVTSIGDNAFYNCSSLQNITLGSVVTSIGDYAFWFCSSLESITVESGNSKYHSKDNCLIETATNTLILGCKNSIIPNYITSIGSGAFSGCSSLTSINIPNSVTSIGGDVFSACSSLESITVESGNSKYHSKDNCLIETATNTLILGCKNSVIPNYVTSIGSGAFYNCSGLTSITIPNSVTSIGGFAFSGCSSLESITFNGTKEQWNVISKGIYWDNNTVNYTIHCFDGDISK